jgi:thiol-disulfide isomerase/thioredoxin
MAERRQGLSGKARLGVAGALIAVVLAAGIYVTGGGQGNGGDSMACAAAVPRAAALDPLVGGEIAAFQIARSPKKLSDLAFAGLDGKPTTLAAFEGRIALVNLWATWCAPCRKEMPALDRLEAALGGAEFAVVPVSIDIGDPERPAEFLRSIGVVNLPLYTDRSTEIFETLKTRGLAVGLPVTVLLDRDGCSLGHMNGPAEWDSEEGRKLIEAAIGSGHADQARVESLGLLLSALDAVPAVELGLVERRVGVLE